MTTILTAFAIACVVMVIALVPYGKVLLAQALDNTAGSTAGRRSREPAPMSRMDRLWQVVFYASWVAIVALTILLLAVTPGALTPGNVVVLVVVVGGWWVMFGGILWLARAFARANAGDKADPLKHPVSQTFSAPPPGAADALAGAADASPPRRAGPNAVISFYGWVIGLSFFIYALGATVPAIESLADIGPERQQFVLIAASAVGAVGFLLFWAGAIALILREGHPMTEADIERFNGNRATPPGGLFTWSRSFYWLGDNAFSRSVSFNFTAADMKRAWRAGAWRADATWRAVYAFLVGAAAQFLAVALFLFVFSTPMWKSFIAAVVLYAVLRTGWTLARA
jgi:hypothetical protein